MGTKRRFGRIRRRPSGRWQVGYTGPDGKIRYAEQTFPTKGMAETWLAGIETDLHRGAWKAPEGGDITLHEWADYWIAHRPDLRPRTRELYVGLLANHILPAFEEYRLADITTSVVRDWHASLFGKKQIGPTVVARCYRLLRGMLQTAVEDGRIATNPCIIKGAGIEHIPERPIATLAEITALADVIIPKYRVMVLLAVWCGLRLGELLALTRKDIDLLRNTVRIERTYQELRDGKMIISPPKTEAGLRTVAIPPHIIPEIEAHMTTWVQPESEALVFTGQDGKPLRRGVWQFAWTQARKSVNLTGLHFHDLRHTGNTLAAATGASTKELMARMGHASPRAALIYQHATEDRDAVIAQALSGIQAKMQVIKFPGQHREDR